MSELLLRLKSVPRHAFVPFVAGVLLVASVGVGIADIGTTSDSGSTSTGDATFEGATTAGGDGESDGSLDSGGTGTGLVNNEVVVLNQTDGSFKNRAGFGTARVLSDTVDNQNAAAAYSRCNECRTVAVAVQVVLVQRTAHVVTPKNYAVAINYECQRCETFAGAYQYVVSTEGIVRFTAAGEARMAAIHNEIRSVAALDIPFPELDARLDGLVAELWATVDSEMRSVGVPFEGRPSQLVDIDASDATPSPTPTTAETPGSGVESDPTDEVPSDPPSSEVPSTPATYASETASPEPSPSG